MDPARVNSLQSALEFQGAMLGRHEDELAATHHAVDSLATRVTDIVQQLHHLRTEPTSSRGHESPEPRVNIPPCYSGEPKECRSFLTQCEVVFSLQTSTYATDRSRIAFVVSLLTGRAREWGTAMWTSEADCLRRYSAFKEEMLRVFDRSAYGAEASRLMSTLRQGRGSAADFSIEFRTLSASCDWNEPALVARFLEGLNADIKDEILARETPTRLDPLIDLAIRVERRFEMCRRSRGLGRVPLTTPAPSSAPPPVSDSEPMQRGGLRISAAERQRRIMARLCMYCASASHRVASCPVKGQCSPEERGLLVSASVLDPPTCTRSTFPALLRWPGYSTSCQVLIDSGAEGNFVDEGWAREQGITLIERNDSTSIHALDGSILTRAHLATAPVSLTISGNHRETISFLVLHSPSSPVILGHPWLVEHNPQINWARGSILSWNLSCHVKCLMSAVPPVSSVSVFQEEPGDLAGVPREYHDLRAVFSRSRATSLPPHRPYDCAIDLLPGTTPPRGRLYSLSAPEREALEKYLSDSLEAGTIVPSSSPAGAGFFFVKKKDGSLRPCIDYRGLNDITVKNRYPLPLMSSAFEVLQGAKIFSKLDLRNAYHLVRIRRGDEWKTAFNTPLGHFEYRVLPFGLVNAPAVFQALINDVLRDMLNIFVFVYLDDILIFSPSLQVHTQHVRQVLQRLLENRLFVKAEKCTFHAQSISFLGSIISAEGVSMDSSKVRAVTEWPVPESRVALQRFLGFANFYRRFIRNFSQIAAPLSALTSVRVQFSWTQEAQTAFDRLKSLFPSAPILRSPDVSRQFIVEVDASEVGVGAILSQRSSSDEKVHPCAYFSHRLSPAERNYDVGNRELLAIRLALGEWRHWLEGSVVPFVVWTDHRNLEYIRSAKRLCARQARWALFFTRFNFSISYRPGSKNLKPDALSRQFTSPEVVPNKEEILPKGVVVGAAVWGIERLVKRSLAHAITPRLCPRGLLFVPPSARLAVLQWGHSSKLFAHPGVRGTIAAIRQRFWWPSRERDVRRFIASCTVCAQTKSGNSPPAGLLRPLPLPSRPWSHIALDFITGLPSSQGNTVILTVVDRFSKTARFIPLPKLPSARETAQIIVDQVFKIHGLPSDVVSDRGPQFSSLFWKEFCRLIGASASLSSGFHPQTNGQAERANQTIGRILRSLAFRNPVSWSEQLSWAEYALNSAPSSATGLSPFQCCLGYQPPLFSSQETESKVPSVQAFIQRAKRTWREVRSALVKSRSRTRRAANRRRVKSPRYSVGQRVWLSTLNLPLQSTSRKLAPKFIGPFRILKILSPVSVRLKLSANLRRVHPVFHVSCIKPVIRAPPQPATPPVRVEGAPVYRVRRLLDVRPRGRGHQFLVDWEGYGPEERCWIPSRDVLDRSLIDDFYRSRQSSSVAPGGAP
ncbi:retrotransposable element [Pimephales promelas]|nr:retrotransposable element [Pimephales promelas]